MNRIVHELQLFRHLALTGANLIYLVLGMAVAAMAALADGWHRWLFTFMVIVYLLTTSPDFRGYQVLNLSRRHWARHKQRLVTIFALAMLVTIGLVAAITAAGFDGVLVGCVLAVLAYRLIWLPKPAEPIGQRAQQPGAESSAGWISMSPVNQIIRVPQGRTWVGLWLSYLAVVLVIDIVTGIFSEPEPGRIIVVAVMIVLFTALHIMQTVGQSLRRWVQFGGNRTRWARETAMMGVIGPVMVVLAGGLYIWLAGTEHAAFTVGVLLVAALMVPVLSVLLELAGRNGTWWAVGGFATASALFLLLYALGDVSGLGVMALTAVQYLVFALILPAVARNHFVFGTGVRGWFGVKAADRV